MEIYYEEEKAERETKYDEFNEKITMMNKIDDYMNEKDSAGEVVTTISEDTMKELGLDVLVDDLKIMSKEELLKTELENIYGLCNDNKDRLKKEIKDEEKRKREEEMAKEEPGEMKMEEEEATL